MSSRRFSGRARVSMMLACCTFLIAVVRGPHIEEPTNSLVHAQSKSDDNQEKPNKGKQEQSKARLREMHMRAKATTIVQIGSDKQTLGKLVPEPVFRYSDQPRRVIDATLWCWHVEGRPIALQKVEYYHRPNYYWFYCMASLSETLIEADWRDGQHWSSKKPGIQLQMLPGGPAPASKKAARLRQIKEIARRFSAKIDRTATIQQEMRFLPRPIHRYGDPDSELRDGAIFGFTTHGTNPDALLLIELHQQEATTSSWKYGLAQMTTGKLSVRLDNKEVWTAPFRKLRAVAKFDTFMFFVESSQADDK